MPATDHRIVLVRHGRSAHPPAGWHDSDGVLRWLDAYDAAGLAANEVPTAAARDLAARAGLVVASDLPRARASAALLAPEAQVVVSELLRETPLPIPVIRVRLPIPAWALVIGAGVAYRALRRVPPPEAARTQGIAAAEWLTELAARHGTIVAVTHANVRGYIAAGLGAAAWRREPGGSRHAHWSAWTFVRTD